MKNIIYSIITVLILNTNVFALFGSGGGIVSDPTSYTYYAKQIKSMNDQIKTSLDQLKVINKANEYLNKANKIITESGERIYNPAKQIMGLANNVKSMQNKFNRMAKNAGKMGVERFFKSYHSTNEPLKDDVMKKWKDDFQALFDNKEDEKYQDLNEKIRRSIKNENYTAYQKANKDLNDYVKLKGIERNVIKKYALLAPMEIYNDYIMNEETVVSREENNQRIQDLAKQIMTEKDMIKQQQTTNQLLLEMLYVYQSQYELQMKFFYAISINTISSNQENSKVDLLKVKEAKENYRSSKDYIKSKSRDELIKHLQDLGRQGKKLRKKYKLL